MHSTYEITRSCEHSSILKILYCLTRYERLSVWFSRTVTYAKSNQWHCIKVLYHPPYLSLCIPLFHVMIWGCEAVADIQLRHPLELLRPPLEDLQSVTLSVSFVFGSSLITLSFCCECSSREDCIGFTQQTFQSSSKHWQPDIAPTHFHYITTTWEVLNEAIKVASYTSFNYSNSTSSWQTLFSAWEEIPSCPQTTNQPQRHLQCLYLLWPLPLPNYKPIGHHGPEALLQDNTILTLTQNPQTLLSRRRSYAR